jgi:hypothetical protein
MTLESDPSHFRPILFFWGKSDKSVVSLFCWNYCQISCLEIIEHSQLYLVMKSKKIQHCITPNSKDTTYHIQCSIKQRSCSILKHILLKQSTVAFTNLRGPEAHFRARPNSEYLNVTGNTYTLSKSSKRA